MKKNKQTPLWRVTGNLFPHSSFILGTMHLKPKGTTTQWQTPFLPYIDSCEVFATEFPLNEVDPNLLGKFSLLPDNQLLSDYLSEKKINKLEKILLKSLGLPLRSLLRMKPLMIVNLITERMLASYQPISMDNDLWKIAETKGKQLEGIETFEEQLRILDNIPIDYQLKNLLSITKNIGQYRKQLLHLVTIYEKGDIQKLYQLSKKGMGSIKKLMLIERNHLMADRFFERTKDTSLFCALGAGHLGGKEGVLRLLKQKGLKVKPILFK